MLLTVSCECGRSLGIHPKFGGRTFICACGRLLEAPLTSDPPTAAHGRQRRPRLTAVGWAFLVLPAVALVAGGVAASALSVPDPTWRKVYRLLLGGGLLGLVAVLAAALRVSGVRFFRD
jgi:hypothetical protein